MARRQVVFRTVNERIAQLTGLFNESGTGLLQTGVTLLICECGDPACAESLEITPEEYEAVRANPARFVVVQGHQTPESERVVDRKGRYLVVEKLGAAAEIATAGDPRRIDHHLANNGSMVGRNASESSSARPDRATPTHVAERTAPGAQMT